MLNNNNDLDDHIFNFIKLLGNKDKIDNNAPIPTELRVSTRSATCKLTKSLNIINVANLLKNEIENKILNNHDKNYPILGISMGNIQLNTHANNKRKKKKLNSIEDIIKTNSKNKSNFFNQCTIIIRPDINSRPVNLKLFKNGSSSMTGCFNEFDGYNAMKILLKELYNHPECFYEKDDKDNIEIYNYDISMINSDYSLEFRIDRLELYNILITETELLVTYEPERYPGVKISYFHNNNNKCGLCKCNDDLKCIGKGISNTCKKITIAVFQSGKVIITGARTEIQTIDAYNYINKLISNNYSKIVKMSILDNINLINLKNDNKNKEEDYQEDYVYKKNNNSKDNIEETKNKKKNEYKDNNKSNIKVKIKVIKK